MVWDKQLPASCLTSRGVLGGDVCIGRGEGKRGGSISQWKEEEEEPLPSFLPSSIHRARQKNTIAADADL